MRSEDIHNKFKDKSIRDFLSKEIRKTEMKVRYHEPSRLRDEIKEHKEKIKKLRMMMHYIEKGQNFIEVIEDKGYSIWDISDMLTDYDGKKYFKFVGTEQEYRALVVELKADRRKWLEQQRKKKQLQPPKR